MPKITPDTLILHDRTAGIDRLLKIMQLLRDPEQGCPWDVEQDFKSIAPYTIEEAYEVADAIERNEISELPGELGDLLLQVVFLAQIADEAQQFTFADVVDSICEKMISRHPHVFGTENRDKSAEQQVQDWEAIKAVERGSKSQNHTLDGVAIGLPALTRAVKLQNRAARVGFDWADTKDVLAKIVEEATELVEAGAEGDAAHINEEFGDLMFVVANLARHLKLDPEESLRAANAKFTRRFNAVEDRLRDLGKQPKDSNLREMDALWDDVKRDEL